MKIKKDSVQMRLKYRGPRLWEQEEKGKYFDYFSIIETIRLK